MVLFVCVCVVVIDDRENDKSVVNKGENTQ